jgi:hypothetical protein
MRTVSTIVPLTEWYWPDCLDGSLVLDMALVVRRRGIVRRGAFGQDEDARARPYMDESDADVTRQHAHVIPRGGTGAPAERVRTS